MFRTIGGILAVFGACFQACAEAKAQVPAPESAKVQSLEEVRSIPASVKRITAQGVGDEVIDYLADRGGLEYVEVNSSRQITAASLKKLCSLPGLRRLRLYKCSGFDDEAATALAANKTVLQVFLYACEPAPTSAIVALLESKTLTSLGLAYMTGVNEESLRACSASSNIADLHLVLNGHVEDDAIPEIARLSRLERLYLNAPSVGDAGIAALRNCKSLKELNLNCSADGSFTESLFPHPSLSTLRLSGKQTSPDSLNFDQAKSLRSIALSAGTFTKDSNLDFLLPLADLEELSFNSRWMAGHWQKLAKALGNLKILWISGTDITDADLVEIAKLPGLIELRLAGCDKITAGGLNELLKLPNLGTLDLYGCRGIKHEEVEVFAKEFRKTNPGRILIFPTGPG